MKQVLSYLKYYIKESILGPLFKLFEALFDLFVPLVMAAMIDKGIANRDTDYVLKMCGLLVLLAVVLTGASDFGAASWIDPNVLASRWTVANATDAQEKTEALRMVRHR